MNRKTFMLAMMLTTITTINSLYGAISSRIDIPSEPWKCGDKVREIPTVSIGGACWMNANIGYSKHNYGAYYTWEEAIDVCANVFGDGWILPTKTDADAIQNKTLSTWNAQHLAGYLVNGEVKLVGSIMSRDLHAAIWDPAGTWTSTMSETGVGNIMVIGAGYSCRHRGLDYGWPGLCYRETNYCWKNKGGCSGGTHNWAVWSMESGGARPAQMGKYPVRCIKK